MSQLTKIKKNRHIFLILTIVLMFFGAILVIWGIKKPTNQRVKASNTTTIAFSPNQLTVNPDASASADIIITPNSNQVGSFKIVLNYDITQVDKDSVVLVASPAAFPNITDISTKTCNGNLCTISLSADIGSDLSKVITSATTAATIGFKPLVATSTISFDSSTQVYDISQPKQNVLATVGDPFVVTVPQICKPNILNCQWDSLADAVIYHYKILDVFNNAIIIEGNTDKTKVEFPQVSSGAYSCSVYAVGACKVNGQTTTGVLTCNVSPTPTIPVVPSLTPTPTIPSTPTPGPTGVINPPSCTSLAIDRAASGTAPYAVTFTGIGTDTSGNIISANFIFGDGQNQVVTTGGNLGQQSVSVQVSHQYANVGSYTASVIFTDSNNNTSITSKNCSLQISTLVNNTPPPPPPVRFVSNPPVVINTVAPLVNNVAQIAKTGPGDIIMEIGIVGIITGFIGLIFAVL